MPWQDLLFHNPAETERSESMVFQGCERVYYIYIYIYLFIERERERERERFFQSEICCGKMLGPVPAVSSADCLVYIQRRSGSFFCDTIASLERSSTWNNLNFGGV